MITYNSHFRQFAPLAALVLLASQATAKGTAEDAVLLSERFSDDDLSAWTVVDEGHLNGPSSWNKIGGRLTQRSNIWGGSNEANAIEKPGSYLLYNAGTAWRDYAIKVRFRSDDDDALGIMFRVSGNDYYRFSWDRSRRYRRLVKFIGGEFSLLAEDRAGYDQRRDYVLEVSVVESTISVRVDGHPVFKVDDDSLGSGSVAFYTWSNRSTFFDDLKVSALGNWHQPAGADASQPLAQTDPPEVVDNSTALTGLKVAPAFAAASARPLPGNLAVWRGFATKAPSDLSVPAPPGTLDQLARVLLVAKLTGVGQAADYAALQVFNVALLPPLERKPRREALASPLEVRTDP